MRFSRLAALSTAVLLAGGLAGCPKKKKVPEPTPTPMPTPDITETPEPVVECDLGTVYFDLDRFNIRGTERTTLQDNADCLKKNPDWRITVAGHADERGSNDYNLALGEKRATAVRDYLVNLGVSAGQLTTISYGEERPAVQGSNEEAWSQNRRVEFER